MQNISIDFNLMNRYKKSNPSAEAISNNFIKGLDFYGHGENFKFNKVTEIPVPQTDSYTVRVEFSTEEPIFSSDKEYEYNGITKSISHAADNIIFDRSLFFESHRSNLSLVS